MGTGNAPRGVVTALVVAATVSAGVGAAGAGGSVQAAAPAVADPPNLVVILVDDARVDDLDPRFMPQANALIGDQGARFTRFYAPFPLCCPARATLLTGQYAHNHGVVWNRAPQGFDAFDDEHTLATWLDPTYRTGMIGKYLNGYGRIDTGYVPPGWNTWRVPVGHSEYNYARFDVNEDGAVRHVQRYSTFYDGNQAVSFVRAAATDDEPFFLQLSFVAPHTGHPHADDATPIASPFVHRIYRDTYAGPPIPEDPSYDEANVSDKNPEIRRRHRLSDEQKARGSELLAQRRESLRSVDDQVARVVGELAAVGELDNTYLLLTSDNGVVLGEHRLPVGKPHLYDPTALVPLLMRGPRVPPGSTVSALTAQTDIAPTLLKLAGLTVAPEDLGRVVDGRNLMPSLQGDAPGRPILLEGHSPVTPTEPGEWIHHGLATERFTYLYFPRWDFEELYDRRNDRYQRSNVTGDEEYAGILERMRDLWEHYRWCVGGECRSGTWPTFPS